jgi:hypothetical protein
MGRNLQINEPLKTRAPLPEAAIMSDSLYWLLERFNGPRIDFDVARVLNFSMVGWRVAVDADIIHFPS